MTYFRRTGSLLALVVLFAAAMAACGGDEDGEVSSASVGVSSPADGATVSSPVIVVMTATDFMIEPAGSVSDQAGHFHVMIDVPCVTPGETIPVDDNHLHFGDGAGRAELELAAGEYELCIQAGDGIHTALDSTETITITVEN